MSLWREMDGPNQIQSFILRRAVRVVESQSEVATMSLVDSVDEQTVLEELLDSSKPLPPGNREFDYLLTTPFRYPPLPYGSRFGDRQQPGILYASMKVECALAESAYYRLVFLAALEQPFSKALITEHDAFHFSIKTDRAVLLDQPPFSAAESALSSPTDYSHTQLLGRQARDAGVTLFRYISARDPQRGFNLAVFSTDALLSRRAGPLEGWICQSTPERIGFKHKTAGTTLNFELAEFLVDDQLPAPAC